MAASRAASRGATGSRGHRRDGTIVQRGIIAAAGGARGQQAVGATASVEGLSGAIRLGAGRLAQLAPTG
jgi:hypothetical protein